MLVVHLDHTLVLPALHRGDPFLALGYFLLPWLLLEDHLPLLGHLIFLPFLLQVRNGEQANCRSRRGGGGEGEQEDVGTLRRPSMPTPCSFLRGAFSSLFSYSRSFPLFPLSCHLCVRWWDRRCEHLKLCCSSLESETWTTCALVLLAPLSRPWDETGLSRSWATAVMKLSLLLRLQLRRENNERVAQLTGDLLKLENQAPRHLSGLVEDCLLLSCGPCPGTYLTRAQSRGWGGQLSISCLHSQTLQTSAPC